MYVPKVVATTTASPVDPDADDEDAAAPSATPGVVLLILLANSLEAVPRTLLKALMNDMVSING
jgi:hypothetical protein